MPLLCADLRQLQRAALSPFAELQPDAVAAPAVLSELRDLDPPLLELLWVSLGLELAGWRAAWPELEAALSDACARCEPACGELAAWVAELSQRPVALAPSLGPRGRAFRWMLCPEPPADAGGGGRAPWAALAADPAPPPAPP